MAEFEELRLTVNLVDNASTGLQRIRAEIGTLTKTAGDMVTQFEKAGAGVTQLGTAVTKAAPGVRTLQTEMRALHRSAEETGRGLATMAISVGQGGQSYSMLAMGLGQAARGVMGLSTSLGAVAPAARVAALAIGGVGIAIVGVGAALAIYGYQTFKFAREMDQLAKTAKTIGISFAELKNAQDQAKVFGQSAESVVRSMQGIQAAQFDLWQNNSQLRQRLLAQGVSPDWIKGLSANPREMHNQFVEYGRALEQQALASGAGEMVARALRSKFLSEAAIAPDAEIIKPPTPEMAATLKTIEENSKAIAKVWEGITKKWDEMTLKGFADALPYVLTGVETLSRWFDKIVAATNDLSEWARDFKSPIPNIFAPGGTSTLPESQQRAPRTPAESLARGYQPMSFGGGGGGGDHDELEGIIKAGTYAALVEWANVMQGGGAGGGGGFQNASFGGSAGAARGGGVSGFKSGGGYDLLGQGAGGGGGGGGGESGGGTTRGDRNNNPGNLKFGPHAKAFGATGADDKGFAIFPNRESGSAAQETLIKSDRYKGLTLQQFSQKYAEGSKDWTSTVGKAMGIGPNDIVNNQDPALLGAIRKAEGTAGGGGLAGVGATGGHVAGFPVIGKGGLEGKSLFEPMSGTMGGGVGGHSAKFGAGRHQGVDIMGPVGSSVYATQGGTVVTAPQQGGGIDQTLTIRHPDGTYSRYLHQGYGGMKVGQEVTGGQVVGKSGYRNAPHTHFEMWRGAPGGRDSALINPKQVFGWGKDRPAVGGRETVVGGGQDRAALDRPALNKTQEVNATGKLSVDVKAPPGTSVEASGGGLFRNTELQRSTAMPYTGSGPSASETANQYMAGR